MDIDKEIERAITRIDEKRRELRIEQVRLHSLRCQKAGIQIGDFVRSTSDGSMGHELYRVCEVDFSNLISHAKPWITADLWRTESWWGTRTRHLYDEWVKVDPDKDLQ